jgi:Na+-transporting methylmalonyl-CoA/oxaloacetate decarboxylase gamma subunit
MTLLEAFTVSTLGITVVFIGLVLCILFINAFNRVARHVKWGDEGGHGHAAHAPKPAPGVDSSVPSPASVPAAPAARALPFVPPTPEVIAVIAAALEMEQRLYYGSHITQKLTIRRTNG